MVHAERKTTNLNTAQVMPAFHILLLIKNFFAHFFSSFRSNNSKARASRRKQIGAS